MTKTCPDCDATVHSISQCPVCGNIDSKYCGAPSKCPRLNRMGAIERRADEIDAALGGEELGYATRLLEHFIAEHFPHNPDWKPLPDLMGVLTQLDNAITIARDYKARLAALSTSQPNRMGTTPEMENLYEQFGGESEEITFTANKDNDLGAKMASEEITPDPRGPFFLTQWEREDYERNKRGEKPLGPRSQLAAMPALCPDCGRSIDGPTHAAYCAATPEMQKMYDEVGGERKKIAHPKRPDEADYEYDDLVRRIKDFGGEGMVVGILQMYALAQPSCGSYAGSLWAIAEWLNERLAALAATPAVGILSREKSDRILSECGYEPATPAVGGEAPEIWLLAGRLAGAELNYRNSYERLGGNHIETGCAWDKMRAAGNAIRAISDNAWEAATLLAAQPASPLRGRDLDIPIEIDCYEPLTLREIIVAYFMADNRPYDGLGKRHADRYLAAFSASPPEQPAADPVRRISMDDVRLVAGEGKLTANAVLEACNAVIRMRSDKETQP